MLGPGAWGRASRPDCPYGVFKPRSRLGGDRRLPMLVGGAWWNAEQVLDKLMLSRLLPRGATWSTNPWLGFSSFYPWFSCCALVSWLPFGWVYFIYRTSKRTTACLCGHAVSFLQSMCGSRDHGSLLPELLRYYYFSYLCSFKFSSTSHQCGPLAIVTNGSQYLLVCPKVLVLFSMSQAEKSSLYGIPVHIHYCLTEQCYSYALI
jgi:hypothetical protein